MVLLAAISASSGEQDSYGSPQAAPVKNQDSYGSPQAAPVQNQDSYGSPQSSPVKAPAPQQNYNAPAQPVAPQTQGYYYYYYPVTSGNHGGGGGGGHKPSYSPPSYSSSSSGGGLDFGGFGTIIAIGVGLLILLAIAGLFFNNNGRSFYEDWSLDQESLDSLTEGVYTAVRLWQSLQ